MGGLRFVGSDGSMGLERGEVYGCEVTGFGTGNGWLYLSVWREGSEHEPVTVPYRSIKTLMENWELP